MNLIDDTIAEFGRSLGLTELRLGTNASLALALESIGTLAFDVAGRAQTSVVISLSKALPPAADLDARMLLGLTHHRHRSPLSFHVGVRHGQLVCAVVVAENDFTLAKIHEAIRLLDRQHQTLEAAV